MSIDVHTHAFHPKVADKVLEQLRLHYGITPVGTGLLGDLKARLKRACIERAVLLSAATNALQVEVVNDWAIGLRADPMLEPFGSLHPDYTHWEKELRRLEDAGILGLKFHPDFQGFRLDDPGLGPMWEAISDRFLLLFHMGDRTAPERTLSSARRLNWLRRNFPALRVVAAHLGGVFQWAHAIEHLVGQDVYLDTSSVIGMISDSDLRTILRRHPSDRLLFGSDYPLFDQSEELRRWQRRIRVSDGWMQDLLDRGDLLLRDFAASQGRAVRAETAPQSRDASGSSA